MSFHDLRRVLLSAATVVLIGAGCSDATYTAAPVHWHGYLTLSVCGKEQSIRDKGTQTVHAGASLLHTHGDNTIHIEGRIVKKEDIALGRFFDAIDVPFGPDRFFDKEGAAACNDGNPDSLHVKVNGADISDPVNYVVQDQDKIEIKFE